MCVFKLADLEQKKIYLYKQKKIFVEKIEVYEL